MHRVVRMQDNDTYSGLQKQWKKTSKDHLSKAKSSLFDDAPKEIEIDYR